MLKQSPIGRHLNAAQQMLANMRAFRLHPSDNTKVIQSFFIALDTPLSLSCYLMHKYQENDQLVSKELNPSDYESPEKFRDDFAAVSFLRKHATLKTSFDRKKNALNTFWEFESACKSTNEFLRYNLRYQRKTDIDENILSYVIRKIDRILGNFCIDTVLDRGAFGPGVTLSVKGEATSQAHKFDVDRDITAHALSLYGPVLAAAYPNWIGNDFKYNIVKGNKICTVPKNAKTDRTIAIEPGMNSWIQKGIGSLIRMRLRRAGFNLNSDLKNQRGAYLGSVDGQLATIDFRAASDTLSREVVRTLLPPDWYTALDCARSHYFTIDSSSHFSEKFSTMGNGFTFELESLIFVAIGLAICESHGLDDSGVSIFGDDLIVPSVIVEELNQFCKSLGFTVNTQKSFSSGYFRESCGSYYFRGLDVKPIFLKKDLNHVKDVYRLANAIRGLSHRRAFSSGCDNRLRSIWSLCVHQLPQSLRLYGPVFAGDAAIHVNKDELPPQYLEALEKGKPPGWEGYVYSGLPSIAVNMDLGTHGLLLSRLHRASEMEYGNSISLRARTKTLFKKRMFVNQWNDLGPWVSWA